MSQCSVVGTRAPPCVHNVELSSFWFSNQSGSTLVNEVNGISPLNLHKLADPGGAQTAAESAFDKPISSAHKIIS